MNQQPHHVSSGTIARYHSTSIHPGMAWMGACNNIGTSGAWGSLSGNPSMANCNYGDITVRRGSFESLPDPESASTRWSFRCITDSGSSSATSIGVAASTPARQHRQPLSTRTERPPQT
ncbi:hypothetical protein BYT27DRAFT_7264719 [Phlegmacium glaucopus]|nr:hypothetical protein BYT27DRAFT_7264719 [Phlegmacium glaucopus]